VFFVFQFVEVQHDVGLSLEVTFESVECHSHDISVMKLTAARDAANLDPQLVNEIDVVFGEVRRMRAKRKHVLDGVSLDYFECNLAACFLRQALPGSPKFTRLVLGGHLCRQPGYYHSRIESPPGLSS